MGGAAAAGRARAWPRRSRPADRDASRLLRHCSARRSRRAAESTLRDVLPALRRRPGAGASSRRARPRSTVFYFPGCGSERLYCRDLHGRAPRAARDRHAGGAAAALPLLRLPGPRQRQARRSTARMVLRDTILFSQIREMFAYLQFDACVVTCGTCREGLRRAWSVEEIFGAPAGGCGRLRARARASAVAGQAGGCLYHAPCHDSLDGEGAPRWSATGRLRGRRACPTAAPRPARWPSPGRTSPTPCSTASGRRCRRHRRRPERPGDPHQLPLLPAGAGPQPHPGCAPGASGRAPGRIPGRRALAAGDGQPRRQGRGGGVLRPAGPGMQLRQLIRENPRTI